MGATLSGTKTVFVTFSEEMDVSSVENVTNYSINNDITVDSASLQNGNTVVKLSTSSHSPNILYTITVNNVTDLSGNVILPQANTAQYQKENNGGGNKAKIHIGHASAQWYQNYTPDRSIDDNPDPSSDSRWAGVLPMPDSIIFDLNEVSSSMRHTFHIIEGPGQDIHFSVQVSTDAVEWTEVLTNVVSSSAQWTVNQFDSVNARYVKLILFNSNESTFAGLWEAEIWGPDQTTGNEVKIKFLRTLALSKIIPILLTRRLQSDLIFRLTSMSELTFTISSERW